jgi:hypothetical protein
MHLFDQNLTQIHVTIPSLQKIWKDSENMSTTRKAQMKHIKNPKKRAIFGLSNHMWGLRKHGSNGKLKK